MRINSENKSMDMESRDINYILPAYVRSYLFHSKNEMPEKIIFPMFQSVKVDDKVIPIEYVPPLDEVATEIANDGSNVAEVTSAQEATLDEKDEEIKRLKAQVSTLETTGEAQELVEDIKENGMTIIPAPEDLIRQQEESAIPEEPEPASKAKAAFKVDPDPTHQPAPDRKPTQTPGGDIGPGAGLSDMGPRGRQDQVRTARDLLDEPDIDETKEKDFDQEVSRGDDGKPVVEDKNE